MTIRLLIAALCVAVPSLSFANSLSIGIEHNTITSGAVQYKGTSYSAGAKVDIGKGFRADLAFNSGKVGGTSKYDFNGTGYGVSYVKSISDATDVTFGLGRLHSSVTVAGTKTSLKGTYYKVGLNHRINDTYTFDIGTSHAIIAGTKSNTMSAGIGYQVNPTLKVRGGYESSKNTKAYSATVTTDF
jgi:hypothetical protein